MADYIRTALPLLCSHRRLNSSYPLVVMGVNLTKSETSTLLAHGAHAVLQIDGFVSHLRAWWAKRQPPRQDCTLECKPGEYCYHGRGDMLENIVKQCARA